MAAERPEKQTVRQIWVAEVGRADGAALGEPVPLYLTLPGASGRDIQALAAAGLISLTETGAISQPEETRLVAIEHSPDAIVELQRRFPGLKILRDSLQNLLHSTSGLAWPLGENRRLFRAQVINLDLNSPLEASVHNGQLAFPVLTLVHKLAVLHAASPYIDWTLCLTLHGSVSWQEESAQLACRFLASNFNADAGFSDEARAVLGDELHQAIREAPESIRPDTLSAVDQQRVLMVLVPKRIAFETHQVGWRIETYENLRYGGHHAHAAMVTWVLRFNWDVRASTEPQALYRHALAHALSRRGSIDEAGGVVRD